MATSRSTVFVKAVTWARDSHGLFDYESKNVTTETQSISSPVSILREGHEVGFHSL